ncbi:MAG: hypothetical protein WC812_01710 [Candidatus Pacearchaeota archaeon]|jgi:hypothetical protein
MEPLNQQSNPEIKLLFGSKPKDNLPKFLSLIQAMSNKMEITEYQISYLDKYKHYRQAISFAKSKGLYKRAFELCENLTRNPIEQKILSDNIYSKIIPSRRTELKKAFETDSYQIAEFIENSNPFRDYCLNN